MKDQDLSRIKEFIRVSFELEDALKITTTEKKVMLRAVELWAQGPKPPIITDLAVSVPQVSPSTVHRNLKVLIKKGWLQSTQDRRDHRIKYLEPTRHLLKILAVKV